MVATKDIGSVAARALLEGPRGIQILELSGPTELSPADVAQVVGGLLGRPITLAEAPLEAVVPTFTSFGFSANVAGLFQEMYRAIRDGTLSWQGSAGGAVPVRGTVGLDEVLRPLLG